MPIGETFLSIWKAFVAEVFGSLFLVFCGSLMFTFRREDPLGELEDARVPRVGDTFTVAMADVGLRFGMTLAVLATSLGAVSGAHFNPVVSMAALINGRIEWQACIFYVIGQLAGSVSGAFIAWCLGGSGLTLPANIQVATTKAIVMEILITMLLVIVFLGVTDGEGAPLGGVVVGIALSVGHWVGIPFSGGSMNPFRSLASALTENYWDSLWIYFVGPPIGAALAAVLYRFVLGGAKESSL